MTRKTVLLNFSLNGFKPVIARKVALLNMMNIRISVVVNGNRLPVIFK